MWNQLNKRGAPLTSGRSSSQKRLARIQYHNEMARRQYIAYQEELKDKERKRVEEERKRHTDRCKKLNLPTSATSDECRDLENKLEQIKLEKIRLQNPSSSKQVPFFKEPAICLLGQFSNWFTEGFGLDQVGQ